MLKTIFPKTGLTIILEIITVDKIRLLNIWYKYDCPCQQSHYYIPNSKHLRWWLVYRRPEYLWNCLFLPLVWGCMNHCDLYLSCIVVISTPPVLSGRNLKNMVPVSFDIFDWTCTAYKEHTSILTLRNSTWILLGWDRRCIWYYVAN